MSRLSQLFARPSQLFSRTAPRPSRVWRPSLEVLDDRITPTVSSIASSFNGTAIQSGSSLWFNSVMKVNGVGSSPVTIQVDRASITSAAFTVAVPDSVITITPGGTSATTDFDALSNSWIVNVPKGLSGNMFLDGAGLPLPGGLPGGVKPVTWTANFSSDTPGITINWQWATAVYTNFSTNDAALGVKPVDSNSASAYHNSDHAGTPENFKGSVTGGAMGGGGSNWTGSYSPTKSVTPEPYVPPTPPPSQTASLSGRLSGSLFLDYNNDCIKQDGEDGISGVTITLTGTDVNGNAVNLTAVTDSNGFYTFTNLAAGTYQLSKPAASGNWIDTGAAVGTVNGATDGSVVNNSTIGSITLGATDNAIGYNFGELQFA